MVVMSPVLSQQTLRVSSGIPAVRRDEGVLQVVHAHLQRRPSPCRCCDPRYKRSTCARRRCAITSNSQRHPPINTPAMRPDERNPRPPLTLRARGAATPARLLRPARAGETLLTSRGSLVSLKSKTSRIPCSLKRVSIQPAGRLQSGRRLRLAGTKCDRS